MVYVLLCFLLSHLQKAEDDKKGKSNVVPRKKKCALLLSYCGAGYNGMQM